MIASASTFTMIRTRADQPSATAVVMADTMHGADIGAM